MGVVDCLRFEKVLSYLFYLLIERIGFVRSKSVIFLDVFTVLMCDKASCRSCRVETRGLFINSIGLERSVCTSLICMFDYEVDYEDAAAGLNSCCELTILLDLLRKSYSPLVKERYEF